MKLAINRFYVYVYLDPMKPGDYNYGEYHFNYEPFYVGKGAGKRWKCHLSDDKCNAKFKNKIKKIQQVCKCDPIIIKYQEHLQERVAYDLENKMEKSIGRKDLGSGPLCNLQDAGTGGSSNRIISEEMRRKMSKSHIGKEPWNKGKTGLQDAWNKGKNGLQDAWNKGKKGCWSEETLDKMSKSHIGKVVWNKGIKTGPQSESHIRKRAIKLMGNKNSLGKKNVCL